MPDRKGREIWRGREGSAGWLIEEVRGRRKYLKPDWGKGRKDVCKGWGLAGNERQLVI